MSFMPRRGAERALSHAPDSFVAVANRWARDEGSGVFERNVQQEAHPKDADCSYFLQATWVDQNSLAKGPKPRSKVPHHQVH